MSVTKSNKPSSSSSTNITKSNIDPSIPPNQTIYIKNLESKIKKDELKCQLFYLFSTYGKILDIIVTRKEGMRGQAFICFEDLASSTSALRSLDGFMFYGKSLMIQYAKTKSKASILQEFGPEALFDPNFINQKLSKKKDHQVTFSTAGAELQGRERKRAREEAGHRGEIIQNNDDDDDDEEKEADDSDIQNGQPDLKKRRSESTMNANKNDGDSEDGDSMQMANSDSEEEEE